MFDQFDFQLMPVLTSERLQLSEITRDDTEAILNLFGNEDVTRYNDVETLTELREAGELIEFVQDRYNNHIGMRWGIRLAESPDELIGTCGYNWWTRHNRCAEIGYDLHPDYWNKGIMTEALHQLVRFGFQQMNLNRIEADVTPGNEGSVRVLEKIGFVEEGLLRQRGYWKGEFHDLRFFALLREDYAW